MYRGLESRFGVRGLQKTQPYHTDALDHGFREGGSHSVHKIGGH